MEVKPIVHVDREFPHGCYYHKKYKIAYYNEKDSTEACSFRRVCICKKKRNDRIDDVLVAEEMGF